jgi:hypothetical protein
MRVRSILATLASSALLLLLPCAPAGAQTPHPEEEPHAQQELHRNHFGGLLGGSVRSGVDEVAVTLGLEYARVFSRHWAAVGYVELVSSSLARDVIVAVGGVYYPVRGVGVVLAVGAEVADEEGHESELALLVRLGAAYGFRLSENASIGPSVFVDRVPGTTTFVFGLAMVAGF